MLVVCETPLLNTSYYEAPRGLVDSISIPGWRRPAVGAPPAPLLVIAYTLALEIQTVVSGSPSLWTRVTSPPTESLDKVVFSPKTPLLLQNRSGRNPRGVRDVRDFGQARFGLHKQISPAQAATF